MRDTIEQFGTTVVWVARLWRAEVDRRLKPLGMSEARWLALYHLSRSRGPLTQGKLAERLGIRGPTLVGQLDLLEADGWVERCSTAHDRRSKTVRLTPKAQPLVDHIATVIHRVRQELFEGLDPAELERGLGLMRELKSRLERLREVEGDAAAPAPAAPAAAAADLGAR